MSSINQTAPVPEETLSSSREVKTYKAGGFNISISNEIVTFESHRSGTLVVRRLPQTCLAKLEYVLDESKDSITSSALWKIIEPFYAQAFFSVSPPARTYDFWASHKMGAAPPILQTMETLAVPVASFFAHEKRVSIKFTPLLPKEDHTQEIELLLTVDPKGKGSLLIMDKRNGKKNLEFTGVGNAELAANGFLEYAVDAKSLLELRNFLLDRPQSYEHMSRQNAASTDIELMEPTRRENIPNIYPHSRKLPRMRKDSFVECPHEELEFQSRFLDRSHLEILRRRVDAKWAEYRLTNYNLSGSLSIFIPWNNFQHFRARDFEANLCSDNQRARVEAVETLANAPGTYVLQTDFPTRNIHGAAKKILNFVESHTDLWSSRFAALYQPVRPSLAAWYQGAQSFVFSREAPSEPSTHNWLVLTFKETAETFFGTIDIRNTDGEVLSCNFRDKSLSDLQRELYHYSCDPLYPVVQQMGAPRVAQLRKTAELVAQYQAHLKGYLYSAGSKDHKEQNRIAIRLQPMTEITFDVAGDRSVSRINVTQYSRSTILGFGLREYKVTTYLASHTGTTNPKYKLTDLLPCLEDFKNMPFPQTRLFRVMEEMSAEKLLPLPMNTFDNVLAFRDCPHLIRNFSVISDKGGMPRILT